MGEKAATGMLMKIAPYPVTVLPYRLGSLRVCRLWLLSDPDETKFAEGLAHSCRLKWMFPEPPTL